MNFRKSLLLTFTFLFALTLQLSAQSKNAKTDLKPEQMERDVFDAPTYEIETIPFETLGFPILIPAQNLGYQYQFIWDEKEAVDTDKVYGSDDLDQMPLFSADCLTAKDRSKCSNDALKAYLRKNIDYPDPALEKGHDGLERIFFVIDENGKIEGNIKVISKDKPCKGCAKAAVEAIAEMPAWVPGMKNGQPVKTKLVLPVEFNTIK